MKFGSFISKNKKQFTLLLLILVLLVGSSYAWITLTLNTNTQNVVKSGILSIELDDTLVDGISIDKALPITEDEGYALTPYTFTITNDGTLASDYTIYLDDLDLSDGQTRIDDKYLRYSLIKDGDNLSSHLLNSMGVNPNRIVYNGTIEAGVTQSFSMRLWVDYDATNEAINKYFNGQIRVEATQKGKNICRRATTLHTEECTQTDGIYYCSGAGYTTTGSKGTTTITYGNLGTSGTLTSGDAFDCDVNGDGVYDSATERFYYVSSKDRDDTSDYATLIYYNNVASGIPSNTTTFAYNTNDSTYLGPQTAMLQLPTTTQWKTTLSSTTRDIKDETGVTKVTGFDYSGYASRLLTVQEVNKACGITIGSITIGELDRCTYLMENTKYSSSLLTSGYWLESVYSLKLNTAWLISGWGRFNNNSSLLIKLNLGVRPAIEVLKSQIQY